MKTTRNDATIGLALAAMGVLLAAGCGGGGGGSSSSGTGATVGSALVGSYGGTEAAPATTPAQLTLTTAGGTLALPCGSSGTLSAPLVPDATGSARVVGTFTPELGVVMPGGNPPVTASYAATVVGSQVTLVVTTTSLTTTYTLVSGKTADLTDIPCPG